MPIYESKTGSVEEFRERLTEQERAEAAARHECSCQRPVRLRLYCSKWQCGVCMLVMP